MILITDREYADIVTRLARLMDAHRGDNRMFNCARIALSTLCRAERNRNKRINNGNTRIRNQDEEMHRMRA